MARIRRGGKRIRGANGGRTRNEDCCCEEEGPTQCEEYNAARVARYSGGVPNAQLTISGSGCAALDGVWSVPASGAMDGTQWLLDFADFPCPGLPLAGDVQFIHINPQCSLTNTLTIFVNFDAAVTDYRRILSLPAGPIWGVPIEVFPVFGGWPSGMTVFVELP